MASPRSSGSLKAIEERIRKRVFKELSLSLKSELKRVMGPDKRKLPPNFWKAIRLAQTSKSFLLIYQQARTEAPEKISLKDKINAYLSRSTVVEGAEVTTYKWDTETAAEMKFQADVLEAVEILEKAWDKFIKTRLPKIVDKIVMSELESLEI